MQNLRQSKKGFPVLKKTKDACFCHCNFIIPFETPQSIGVVKERFPCPPFPSPKKSGDDESNDSCSELLSQVLILTRPLSRRKVVIVGYTPQEQLGSPAPPGHLHSVPDGRERVQRRAHVQDGELVVLVHCSAVIVIDNVAHLLPTAVNDPVVPVKGQLVPHP